MADMRKPKLEELESELGTNLQEKDENACYCRQVLCHRYCFYLFPVCALIASVFLVSLAFRSHRPGVALGFSFLLLILVIFYCIIGNVSKCYMLPSSEGYDTDDSTCDESNLSVVVVSSSEELGDGI